MLNLVLFAQSPTGNPLYWAGAIVVALAIMAFMFIVLLSRHYKRCPSNRLLVIYGRTGKGKASTTIHGGAAFVIPLIQDYAYLSLEPIQIEIPLRGALSIENIRVNVPSVFTVAISTEPSVMQQASIRLLGLSVDEIRKQAEEIIFGILRQVIAGMGIEEINRDRDKFLQQIQMHLESELNKIGLQLINVNITDITDESGYIDAIGQKAASEAIQKARGDVADNERMGETSVANAERDKLIQVAKAVRDQEIGTRGAERDQAIGTREAERDQAVRVAEMAKEQVVGEKAALFERDSQVKDSELLMRVRIADADAAAIEGENEAQAKVVASQAQLAVRRAEAYEIGESRKREAEATVLEVQNRAMAKAALAEAEKVEAEERAKLEAPAKAQKSKIMVDAEAEAERLSINARAQAEAIFVKLDAEARGNYEILAKKGEGLKQIIDACGGSSEAFQILMLDHLDNLAEASSRAISNIKFDKIVVWENGGKNGRTNTADFISGMAKTLPPMMQVMKDIGGVELPESLIRFTNNETPEPTNSRASSDSTSDETTTEPG